MYMYMYIHLCMYMYILYRSIISPLHHVTLLQYATRESHRPHSCHEWARVQQLLRSAIVSSAVLRCSQIGRMTYDGIIVHV